MLVEFRSVIMDGKETQEREIQEKLHGITSVPFDRERDYLCPTVLNIKEVVGWEVSNLNYNDTIRECVIVKMKDKSYVPTLLIGHNKFKSIYEKINNSKVLTVKDILNEDSTEDNQIK